MSRNQTRRIAMIACAVILLIAVYMSVRGIFGSSPFGYPNAEKYTAGEADITGAVRNLEIDWLNGKVTLAYHSGSSVELREASAKPISADMQLRWWLDGDTLRVQYAKSGFRLTWDQEKELTVTLPEGSAFDHVTVRATSGELNLPEVKADTLNLQVTSGDIRAAAEAKKITAGSTSGSISLKAAGETEAISAGATSGSIQVEAANVDDIRATATSGNILISAAHAKACDAGATSGALTVDLGEADQVKVSSTSGTVSVKLGKFASLKAATTSGAITAELPEQPGFTAQISTISGDIEYDLALSRDGDSYVCGDGTAKADFGSTSGNIRLLRAE